MVASENMGQYLGKRMAVTEREWAVFWVRWLVPLAAGLTWALDAQVRVSPLAQAGLAIGLMLVLSNIVVVLLLLSEYWSRAAVAALAAFDVVAGLALAGLIGPGLAWAPLLPAALVGFYFNWRAGLAAGAAGSAGLIGLLLGVSVPPPAQLSLMMAAVGAPVVGAAAGLLKLDAHAASASALMETSSRRAREMSRIANEYMSIVYDMAAVLSASKLEPRRVISAAVEFGLQGLTRTGLEPPLYSAALLFEEQRDFEGVVEQIVLKPAYISTTMFPSDARISIDGRAGVVGQVVEGADFGLCASPVEDAELSRYQSFKLCKSALVLPLRLGDEAFGVLIAASPRAGAFSDLHAEMMMAVANQTTASLQNARLYTALREQRDRIIAVEKMARAQLASELHDGPTQGVAAITMRLNYTRKLLEKKPEQALSELYTMEDMARRTAKEMRAMLFELRPKALDQSLGEALKQLASKTKETFEQEVAVDIEPGADALLDGHAAQTLFSIAVESVTNARKHAQAPLITLSLRVEGDALILDIADNGQGFDAVRALTEARMREGHLGLLNLQERATLIDGRLEIASEPGEGTVISVIVPLAVLEARRSEQSEQSASMLARNGQRMRQG